MARKTNPDLIHDAGGRSADEVGEIIAKEAGALVARIRGGMSGRALARALKVDPSWVSRVESGQFVLTDEEDYRTIAMACGEKPDDAHAGWLAILDEQNWGVCPWSVKTELDATHRRLGERDERIRQATIDWRDLELVGDINLEVLADMVAHDTLAREAIAAMCHVHARRGAITRREQ